MSVTNCSMKEVQVMAHSPVSPQACKETFSCPQVRINFGLITEVITRLEGYSMKFQQVLFTEGTMKWLGQTGTLTERQTHLLHKSARIVFWLFLFPLWFCVTVTSVDNFLGKFLIQQSRHSSGEVYFVDGSFCMYPWILHVATSFLFSSKEPLQGHGG